MKRLLTFGILLVTLSGCAAVAPEPTVSLEPNSSRTSAFDLDCSQLVPSDLLAAVWDEPLEPRPYHEAGAAGSWEMQATALMQDGALACGWRASGEGSPGLVILALDDAIEGFEVSEPSFLTSEAFPYDPVDSGDGGHTFCRTDTPGPGIRCHWNVLIGDAWVSFYFQDLPDSELTSDGRAVPDSGVGDIVDSAVAAIDGAARIEIERATSELAACERVITPAAIAGTLGVTEADVQTLFGRPVDDSLGRSTPLFGQVMWAYSYQRLGYTECAFGSESMRGTVMVAPGAAWILEEPAAVQPSLREVEGFGSGVDECLTEDDFILCTVAVAIGDDLLLAQVAPQTEEEGHRVALELVTLLAAG